MPASKLATLLLGCTSLGLLGLLMAPKFTTSTTTPQAKYSVYVDGEYYTGFYQTNDYTIHDHMTIIKDTANDNKEVIIRNPHVIVEN